MHLNGLLAFVHGSSKTLIHVFQSEAVGHQLTCRIPMIGEDLHGHLVIRFAAHVAVKHRTENCSIHNLE